MSSPLPIFILLITPSVLNYQQFLKGSGSHEPGLYIWYSHCTDILFLMFVLGIPNHLSIPSPHVSYVSFSSYSFPYDLTPSSTLVAHCLHGCLPAGQQASRVVTVVRSHAFNSSVSLFPNTTSREAEEWWDGHGGGNKRQMQKNKEEGR